MCSLAMTQATIWVRFVASNRSKMFRTWVSTVYGLMSSRSNESGCGFSHQRRRVRKLDARLEHAADLLNGL